MRFVYCFKIDKDRVLKNLFLKYWATVLVKDDFGIVVMLLKLEVTGLTESMQNISLPEYLVDIKNFEYIRTDLYHEE